MSVRLANLAGRAVMLVANAAGAVGAIDVARASDGRFSTDPMQALVAWDAFVEWARGRSASDAMPFAERDLGPPVPRPAKVFGIGMNYRDHAVEAKLEIPSSPVVFTKFPNCISGPYADVALSSDRVDWEVELVVVIGRRGKRIAEKDALAPYLVRRRNGHAVSACARSRYADRHMQGTPAAMVRSIRNR